VGALLFLIVHFAKIINTPYDVIVFCLLISLDSIAAILAFWAKCWMKREK
jgi:hypothetical protein